MQAVRETVQYRAGSTHAYHISAHGTHRVEVFVYALRARKVSTQVGTGDALEAARERSTVCVRFVRETVRYARGIEYAYAEACCAWRIGFAL